MEKIVVGIDGSETAQRALEWAAAEARLRDARLVVVHAWQQPTAALMSPYAALLADCATLEEAARHVLTDSVVEADLAGLAGKVEQLLVQGPAAPALIKAAQTSSLLVVGSRGLGGFAGVLLGSVSRQVAHEATIPVVIIPPTAASTDGHGNERDG